jgi:hypothetical protein
MQLLHLRSNVQYSLMDPALSRDFLSPLALLGNYPIVLLPTPLSMPNKAGGEGKPNSGQEGIWVGDKPRHTRPGLADHPGISATCDKGGWRDGRTIPNRARADGRAAVSILSAVVTRSGS